MGNARKHCAYNLNGDVFMEKIVENDKKGDNANKRKRENGSFPPGRLPENLF